MLTILHDKRILRAWQRPVGPYSSRLNPIIIPKELIMNTNQDFADIAALFNVTTESGAAKPALPDARELTCIEVAGIGGGEGISLWG